MKVFVPTMTFTATAEVIRYLNADPIFLDVDYETATLTPRILEKAIKQHPDVKCLIVVHYGISHSHQVGNSNNNGIKDLCAQEGIRLIEDAAHAFPASQHNQMVGTFGDAAAFSFYANKTITTGEGGMLVTNSTDIYERASVMRLHGINRDVWDRFTNTKAAWEYDVVAPGYKYNLPDLAAAVGIAQLEKGRDNEKFKRGACCFI